MQKEICLSLLLVCAASLQAGCRTYLTPEARQPFPTLPANPDGVCPQIAEGVYPLYSGGSSLTSGHFGTVVQKDESYKDVEIPRSLASRADGVFSVEKLENGMLKIGRIERYIGKLVSIDTVETSFMDRVDNRHLGRHGSLFFCDKGIFYRRSSSVGVMQFDRNHFERTTTISKEANEEIVMKLYTITDVDLFFIFPLGPKMRSVETERFPRLSNKPFDFDALNLDAPK
jgi:hypothetical protein